MMKRKNDTSPRGESPSRLIDVRIQELGDWRGETLSRIRSLIQQADPGVTEEWKWRGVPVWSHDGLICTGETYQNVVKLTFAKGAQLRDPSKLFNSSLEGNARRAIDLHEGDKVDDSAFKALIRDAVALNTSAHRPVHLIGASQRSGRPRLSHFTGGRGRGLSEELAESSGSGAVAGRVAGASGTGSVPRTPRGSV